MEARMMLWLVLAACFCCHSMSRSHLLPTFLKTVVNGTAGAAHQVTGKPGRIGGPNALCLDVKGGDYRAGTPVILWKCKDDGSNQMWTFEGDGTIRSHGWCLGSYDNTRGYYQVIVDCAYTRRDIITWKMENNGAIANPGSGLVLTANSADAGSNVQLETNVFSSYQTWRFGDLEWREVGHIQGQYQCLQMAGSGVSMEGCQSRNRRQYWVYLSDGTIRNPLAPGLCLSYDASERVVLSDCWADAVKQRWFFAGGSGPIVNEAAKLVVEVKGTYRDYQVVVSSATGLDNQNWELVLGWYLF